MIFARARFIADPRFIAGSREYMKAAPDSL
jgi:hypothetical protein